MRLYRVEAMIEGQGWASWEVLALSGTIAMEVCGAEDIPGVLHHTINVNEVPMQGVVVAVSLPAMSSQDTNK